jgi:Holliday junction resolvase RusA-like endonuclease
MVEQVAGLKPWRDTITAAAFGAGPCLDGPLAVKMVFTVPRPKSAPKRLHTPSTTPDLSKLARGCEDAITAAGLWADDARVARYDPLAKAWPGDHGSLPVPGVVVAAVPIDALWVTTHEQLEVLFSAARATAWGRFYDGQVAS